MQAVTKHAAAAAVLGVILFSCAAADAAVLTIPFGNEYTSGITPAGAAPWLTATFDDHGTAGSVTLTLNARLAGASEFVTRVLFNLDPALDPARLTFSAPTKIGTFADAVVETGANAFSAGGGSRFDLQLTFDSSPPANRFGGTESATYTLGGIATLTANSFAFTSTGGSVSLPASAHIQGVGIAGANSSWVTVPEPGAAALLLLGASAAVARRPRR